jgi:Clostripain family
MQISSHRASRGRSSSSPLTRPLSAASTTPHTSPDYVVLVYSANNVSSLGKNGQPVAGSFRLLPELKALASKTTDSKVSIVTQGYEKLETGRWVTRRYRVERGELQDETPEVDGFRSLYGKGNPPEFEGRVKDTGGAVSMFSQEAVEDFLLDAMADYPKAKNVVLFINAHGAPTPQFGGEAIIDQEWQRVRQEEISVRSFGHALENVASKNGMRLSLLDLNTCEMGKVENVLELGEHADFMLASPQNEFVPKGHEYTAAFQDIVGACESLIADSKVSPRGLGERIIDLTTEKTSFVEEGVLENPIPTLDLYDTSKLGGVSSALNAAGLRLSEMLLEGEGRKVVLDALKDSFNYREHVVDLKGFLNRISDPATKKLAGDIDSMVVDSFAGKFRGRDYSEAGPIAVFMPKLPGDDLAPILLPSAGTNVKTGLEELAGPVPEKRLRPWIVGKSAKLHDLHSNLSINYPAMLEVVPNPELQNALGQFSGTEQLLELDQEFQKHMSFSSREKVEPLQKRLDELVAPLKETLEKVDLESWMADFEASGGTEKIVQRAKDKAVARIREGAMEPVKEYQQLDNVPPGWKTFLEDLTNAVVDEEWAKALRFEV